MFTGIIEEVGVVACPGARMRIQCREVLEDLREGASVAVSGVCLTAVRIEPDAFWCDLAPETLARTNLGALGAGSPVNLERAAAVGDRLSGHIVQGHVDGTAEFLALEALGDGNWWLKLRLPAGLDRYVIHKGSIALDGVSLTVAAIEQDTLGIAVIPHTYEHTAMRSYAPGSRLNVEVDVIGKFVEKLMASR
jgi:riboflavin synthase